MTDYVLAYGRPTDKVLRAKMTAEQVAEAGKLAVKIQERIESSKLE